MDMLLNPPAALDLPSKKNHVIKHKKKLDKK